MGWRRVAFWVAVLSALGFACSSNLESKANAQKTKKEETGIERALVVGKTHVLGYINDIVDKFVKYKEMPVAVYCNNGESFFDINEKKRKTGRYMPGTVMVVHNEISLEERIELYKQNNNLSDKEYKKLKKEIVVEKSTNRLKIVIDNKTIHEYTVSLGLDPVHDKLHQGDKCTPEGVFRVTTAGPSGKGFYKSFCLSPYPDRQHIQLYHEAKKLGLIPPGRGYGGNICIHGHKRGQDFTDGIFLHNWTDGCVALRNSDLDEFILFLNKENIRTVNIMWGYESSNKTADPIKKPPKDNRNDKLSQKALRRYHNQMYKTQLRQFNV